MAIFIAVLFMALLAAVCFLIYRLSPRDDSQAVSLLQSQIEALRSHISQNLSQQTQNLNQQLGHIQNQVLSTQKTVGERLDNAARVVGDVQKSLGSLSQASERILEVGKNVAGLEAILSAPKIRGGFGEYFLADLLRQILPAKHFELQYGFKSGHMVDAVIRLGSRLVPVDSKFPLENFKRILECPDDEGRKPLKRKFVADVKRHVDAITAKYILPDEGTYDFAFMYIPAENVYYEVIIKDDAGEDKTLTEYALARRVMPVSPNSFYAYLQAIILGLKGFQIEQNAQEIMQNLARLSGDFTRFREDFEVLGKHIGNARIKYEEAGKRLDRFGDKLVSLEETEKKVLLPPEPKSLV